MVAVGVQWDVCYVGECYEVWGVEPLRVEVVAGSGAPATAGDIEDPFRVGAVLGSGDPGTTKLGSGYSSLVSAASLWMIRMSFQLIHGRAAHVP
jgi:hypothetical protein